MKCQKLHTTEIKIKSKIEIKTEIKIKSKIEIKTEIKLADIARLLPLPFMHVEDVNTATIWTQFILKWH